MVHVPKPYGNYMQATVWEYGAERTMVWINGERPKWPAGSIHLDVNQQLPKKRQQRMQWRRLLQLPKNRQRMQRRRRKRKQRKNRQRMQWRRRKRKEGFGWWRNPSPPRRPNAKPPSPPSSSCTNTVASTRGRWRDVVRLDADVGDHYSDPTMKESWYPINLS
ncbi:hypothetical protein GW17_00061069 [Ensete ventricosum]|nr:hypothetical protein GW17_00061069 [Ensete ventricosum]